MSALGTKAIYIPVARLEFLSCNELSHSVYKASPTVTIFVERAAPQVQD